MQTALQENSPSKATDEMGQNLGKGLEQGMKTAEEGVKTAGQSLGEAALKGIEEALKKVDDVLKKISTSLTTLVEAEAWTTLNTLLTALNEAFAPILEDAKVFETMKTKIDELAADENWNVIKGHLEEINAKLVELKSNSEIKINIKMTGVEEAISKLA